MFSFVLSLLSTICLIYFCANYILKKIKDAKKHEAEQRERIRREYNQPENVIRRTVSAALKETKYEKKEDGDSCSICCDEFE